MAQTRTFFWIAFLSLFLFLSGCEPSTITSPAPTLASPSPTPDHTASATPIIAQDSTPTAETKLKPATTRPPLEFTFLPTTLQHPGDWNLNPPYSHPDLPGLITKTSDGYQLDPAFQVSSIELSYRWIGIGDTIQIYQRVERRGEEFWRGELQLSTDSVAALIRSIARLHPQPQILSSTTHTDDYPTWAIELTGVDGNHLLLYSESNSPKFSPWNVVHNGVIYAQFDGSIADALPDLFLVIEGQTLASFVWQRDWAPGYLTTVTTRAPGQLSYGFSGLLPLYKAFTYHPDPQNGEIYGRVRTLTWNEGMGSMIVGSITDLQKVELDVDGQPVACQIGVSSSSNPESMSWDFTCPVGAPGRGIAYHYPIRVTFATSAYQVYTLSGELYGYWEPGTLIPVVPYPEEIGRILESSPVVRDLLTDHQVKVLKFVTAADPLSGLVDHSWQADIALLGQIQIGARILPYSVTIQVRIEGSKLAQWDLDRSELRTLLADVLDQAITHRFMEMDPNLVLNLYYGEAPEYPLVFEGNLKACAGLPVATSLPAPAQPMRGFGFNQPWDIYAAQILLMQGGLRVNSLDIEPGSPEDAVWVSLLPPELTPQGVPPLRLIFKRPQAQAIGLYWDEHASPTEVERYRAIFENWDVEKEFKDLGVFIDQVMFDITADGQLALIFCQAP